MFLLVVCGPYVSIVWRSAICFYYVRLGHMFLLCGARPYVSIGRLWAWGSAICFYWLAVGVGLGHMFLLCGCGPYVMSHTPKPYAAPYVFIGLPHHWEGTCWRYISSSKKLYWT